MTTSGNKNCICVTFLLLSHGNYVYVLFMTYVIQNRHSDT